MAYRNSHGINGKETVQRDKREEIDKRENFPTPTPSLREWGTERRPPEKCEYCGATVAQTGRAFEPDHFVPVSAGGGNEPENMVWACHVCNQAKSSRVFDSVDEARRWLHAAYWSSSRQRWIHHRAFAFGGAPPDGYRPAAPAFRETDVGKGEEEFEEDRRRKEVVRELSRGALRKMP